MTADLNPFPALSPSGHHVARGSGRVAVDGVVVPLASAWTHGWLDEERVIMSGNTSVSTAANGTYVYSCTGGTLETVAHNGWNALSAGGGAWSGVVSGVKLRHVDGRVLLGAYFDPCVESPNSYAWTKLNQVTNKKALYWNGQVVETRGCVAPRLHDGILTWQIMGEDGLETWGLREFGAQPERWNVGAPQYSSQGLRIDGEIWVLAWDDLRLFLHKVGETTGILVAEGATKDAVAEVVVGAGYVRVCWWGSHPLERRVALDEPQIDLTIPAPPPVPVIPQIGRDCWLWYFKVLSNIASDDGPDYPAWHGLPGHAKHVEFEHQLQESKGFIFPNVSLLNKLAPHRPRIVAIVCHGGSPAALKAQGKASRKKYPTIPTLGICDWPNISTVGRIEGITDIMLEVYPARGETPLQTEIRLAGALASTPYSRVHLVQMAYDQGGMVDDATLMAHQAIAARLAKRFPKVVGIGIFAANRADGLRRHPELIPCHEALAEGITGHPPVRRK